MTLDQIFAITKVVLGFGLVIFIHELGHYLMARRNGVFVEKFAIGFDFFGAKLFTWYRGDTEYVIGAFPLGGYVKMKGQHDLPEDGYVNADDDSYQSKSVWARTQIISAGVIANFLSAFVLCWLAFVIGYHATPSAVGSLSFEALDAGLRPGDVITAVDGSPVKTWDDLVLRYATEEGGSQVPFTVERDGQPKRLMLTIDREPSMPINFPDFQRPVELRVGSLEVGSPADRAGLKAGDRLLGIDGVPARTWAEFSTLIQRRPGQEITVQIERDGERKELTATTDERSPDLVPEVALPFVPKHPPSIDLVEAGSPAEHAGLQVGDVVIAVGGRPVATWYDLWREGTYGTAEGSAVALTVARGEDVLDVTVTPGPIPDWGLPTTALPALGIAGKQPDRLEVGALGPGAPEGLAVGDVIVGAKAEIELGDDPESGKTLTDEWKIERPPKHWMLLMMASQIVPDAPLELTVERDGKRHTLQSVPVAGAGEPVTIGFLGIAPWRTEVLVRKGPIEALGPTLKAPFRILQDFVDGIRAMAMQRASARMLAGPIGILQATYIYAEKSLGDLCNFLALLSVNLAIVNFLPIPITDGGHFVFLMYEKLKGRRMDEELEAKFQWAGLVFILMVFLFATFNDVGRIFGF